MDRYDLIIVGGGISGMTCALTAFENGIKDILIIESEDFLGGVLKQCIHSGFGQKLLNVSLTGPESTALIENRIRDYGIKISLKSTVLNISSEKVVTYVCPEKGVTQIFAKAIMIATGCKEKYTGNIAIPTNKLTGIYTIGNAHRTITMEGYMPGKRPVIVVNSKWGLIVARRMTIEGAKIQALIINENEDFKFDEENKAILEGFEITTIIGSHIIQAYGDERIEGVKLIVNDNKTIMSISCDSLILSVGYFPEIEIVKDLSVDIDSQTRAPIVHDYRTSADGIFACGNLIYGTKALYKKDINGVKAGVRVSEYILNN